MSASQNKRFAKAVGIFIAGTLAVVTFFKAVHTPSIATWEASSSKVDHVLSQKFEIESQIRAIERRNPHKEFEMHVMDQHLFLYAIADGQVVIPGVDGLTPPFPFPIHVISGTGEHGASERNDYLNRIARQFAELFNKEMYGYIVTS